jgi:protein-L-isoaspartate(D-aspartate) O-methyltransferase
MKNPYFTETLKDTINRRQMIEQLDKNGLHISAYVLQAMGRIPRHIFIDPALNHQAYNDIRLPIGCEQTISRPSTVAKMTDLLDVKPHHRVLEIGSGSGYQTAVLAELCLKVYSVEWHPQLARQARTRLHELGYSTVRIEQGDGSQGWPSAAPFDRIIVTAGAPTLPEEVCYQLETNGKMVVPVGAKNAQELLLIHRTDTEEEPVFDVSRHGPCEFVDLVGKLGWPDSL